MTKLSKEQASEMLRELSDHFGEPVLPVSKYCNALRTWKNCVESSAHHGRHGDSYYKELSTIELDISKSSLLYRLIYIGEELRENPCPIHQGVWSGLIDCPHKCEGCGWLPPPTEDEKAIKHIIE